jgi:hypothetical protein
MQTLLLQIEKKRVKKAQKVESTHFWYNPETESIEAHRCGKLSFVFDIQTARLMPKPEDVYINVYTEVSNKQDIEKWIQIHNDYVVINSDSSSMNQIAINVDDNDVGFIQQSLIFAGIRYD